MRIQYVHASKFGNGAAVAEEFRRQAEERGAAVDVHHVRDVNPRTLAPADLYVFSSPGRMGRPIGSMRRFLRRLTLPAGTRYGLLTTEGAPRPDPKTGRMPTDVEVAARQHVRPMMHDILRSAGLVDVAEDVVHVTGLKGPLEEGWQQIVTRFVDQTVPDQGRRGMPRAG